MTRWWIAGLTVALGLACATSPADPELPPPYVPSDDELSGDDPPARDGRRRGGRKAAQRGGRRPGRSRPPVGEAPVEEPSPDPAPAPAPDGGGGERSVGTACDAACDHVVECDIATYSECTGYCAGLSRDQLETARDLSCAQLRAIIDQYR